MDQQSPRTAGSLDPADWNEFLAVAHRAMDDAVRRIGSLRDEPVWRPMPEGVRQSFQSPLPTDPQPLADIYREVMEDVIPHAMGNVHPRFWGWYMGAGDLTGALADFLAGVDGSNLGGGDTAAALVDRQVTDWIRQMMGFPDGASAALVSGGSGANLIGLAAARNAKAGVDLREYGLEAMPQSLAFYASDQVHNCHDKAMNLLGLGHRALRRVQTGPDFRIEIDALRQQVTADRRAGIRPACVIATAGTTNTGSVDDLTAIADFCRDEGLWLHIDGCIGALLAISPKGAALVRGLDRADSLALDLHKWLHAPFDVGCILIRDRGLHLSTFSEDAEFLVRSERGLAAGEFLYNYTLETTRGFRALKIWMMLKHHGVARFGALIDRNLDQARMLGLMVASDPALELLAPVATSVVCFRYNPGGIEEADLNALNRELLLRLQETGVAAPSGTTVRDRYALRAAFCNHRTEMRDLDMLVAAVREIGATLRDEMTLGQTVMT